MRKAEKLKEFFGLFEGAEDMEFRKQAENSVDIVSRKLKAGSIPVEFEGPDDSESPSWAKADREATYAVFDLSSIPGHEHMELALGMSQDPNSPGGLFSFSTSLKRERITLTAFDKSNKYATPKSLASWKKVIVKTAGQQLDDPKNRTAYIHEFIHHLDRARISQKGWATQAKAANAQGGPNYYNNPIETNAFTQMGLSSMAHHLKNVKTKAGAEMLMGGSPQGFAKTALKHMDQQFIKNLSDDNRRKLLKRIYQLYQDVVKNLK